MAELARPRRAGGIDSAIIWGVPPLVTGAALAASRTRAIAGPIESETSIHRRALLPSEGA